MALVQVRLKRLELSGGEAVMADKINGYGGSGLDITPARSRAPAPGVHEADTGKAGQGRQAEASSTSTDLRLTNTATNLKQVEVQLAKLPDVDRARVEAVRQRVESGAYAVNAGRLADRLLAFERDLA